VWPQHQGSPLGRLARFDSAGPLSLQLPFCAAHSAGEDLQKVPPFSFRDSHRTMQRGSTARPGTGSIRLGTLAGRVFAWKLKCLVPVDESLYPSSPFPLYTFFSLSLSSPIRSFIRFSLSLSPAFTSSFPAPIPSSFLSILRSGSAAAPGATRARRHRQSRLCPLRRLQPPASNPRTCAFDTVTNWRQFLGALGSRSVNVVAVEDFADFADHSVLVHEQLFLHLCAHLLLPDVLQGKRRPRACCIISYHIILHCMILYHVYVCTLKRLISRDCAMAGTSSSIHLVRSRSTCSSCVCVCLCLKFFHPLRSLALYLCVCTYECMYVCLSVCMHECMYVCTYVCMYVCMHACMQCMHSCMYACMYAFTYACMYACMYAWMYAWMHACMDACMHLRSTCSLLWTLTL
jgi:hypothetical protein